MNDYRVLPETRQRFMRAEKSRVLTVLGYGLCWHSDGTGNDGLLAESRLRVRYRADTYHFDCRNIGRWIWIHYQM